MEEIMEQAKWNTANNTNTHLHPEKVMLCMWWEWKGVLYYELLLENQTIHSNKYGSQLDQLKAVARISQKKMHNLPSG